MNWLEAIGAFTLSRLTEIGRAMILVGQTIKQLPMINFWHVLQQMAHLGVDSLLLPSSSRGAL